MSEAESGWIGVDLDGTLAHYDGWKGAEHIGAPVWVMLKRVRDWLDAGREVRIFTARVYPIVRVIAPDADLEDALQASVSPAESEALLAASWIRSWCAKYIGRYLPITCVKDHAMVELWDDRAVTVERNTGERTTSRSLACSEGALVANLARQVVDSIESELDGRGGLSWKDQLDAEVYEDLRYALRQRVAYVARTFQA